jgi:hypothetical protein
MWCGCGAVTHPGLDGQWVGRNSRRGCLSENLLENAMEINIFTLRTVDDDDNVFAIGMSIVCPDGEQEVVTYRRDPVSGQAMFATFETPGRALARHGMIVPLRLHWHDRTNAVAAAR